MVQWVFWVWLDGIFWAGQDDPLVRYWRVFNAMPVTEDLRCCR